MSENISLVGAIKIFCTALLGQTRPPEGIQTQMYEFGLRKIMSCLELIETYYELSRIVCGFFCTRLVKSTSFGAYALILF